MKQKHKILVAFLISKIQSFQYSKYEIWSSRLDDGF